MRTTSARGRRGGRDSRAPPRRTCRAAAASRPSPGSPRSCVVPTRGPCSSAAPPCAAGGTARPTWTAHRLRSRLPAAPALRGPPAAARRPDRGTAARHGPPRRAAPAGGRPRRDRRPDPGPPPAAPARGQRRPAPVRLPGPCPGATAAPADLRRDDGHARRVHHRRARHRRRGLPPHHRRRPPRRRPRPRPLHRWCERTAHWNSLGTCGGRRWGRARAVRSGGVSARQTWRCVARADASAAVRRPAGMAASRCRGEAGKPRPAREERWATLSS